MVVKHEIKSQLAKLLATEDLIVENKKVETAQFDVQSRVLTLPIWEKASNNVYDSLVAHEVGHALYTPDRDWWKEYKIPQQFVNVVEDARVEKLMKRRYAGLAKTFYTGYNELHDQDFFQVNDEDISTFNLADRINLYFKVGSFLTVDFSSIEKPIVNLVNDCETFDDTLSAAETLYNFCKQECEKKETTEVSEEGTELDLDTSGNISSDNDSSFPDFDIDDSMEGGDGNDDYDSGSNNGVNPVNQGGETNSDLDVKTADALQNSIKELIDNRDSRPNVYIELPKLNLKNIIIENKGIHNNITQSFLQQQVDWSNGEYLSSYNIYLEVDSDFRQFKKSAQKEVNYLVKEFECKKAADSYARATTSRTGVLDTSNLHTYKFNEDLFKKVTTFADGKNHGLVFILDWSGSMAPVMLDTIKQLYNLLWFCKKVNIPFEVYAFTNCYPVSEGFHQVAYEKKSGLAFVEETFSLMNLFSSKVKSNELDEQMLNIFRIAYLQNGNRCLYSIPIGLTLSGTPLNESLIALHQILPKFKKENNIQKVQCVVLTDGESAPLRYSREIQRHWEHEPFMGSKYVHDHCIIRNRKTGYTYSCAGLGHWSDITDLLIKDLRQTFSDTNFIGIRILGNRDASQFIRKYTGYEDTGYDRIMKRWKREKSFTIKNSGYHSYFGLSSNVLGNEDEFEVEEDATKAQIKKAFNKSLKNKKMNKKILGEFIELVA